MSNLRECLCPEGAVEKCVYCGSNLLVVELDKRLRDAEAQLRDEKRPDVLETILDEMVDGKLEELDDKFEKMVEDAIEKVDFESEIAKQLDDIVGDYVPLEKLTETVEEAMEEVLAEHDVIEQAAAGAAKAVIFENERRQNMVNGLRSQVEELEKELDELQSLFLRSQLPKTFFQRLRWLLTGKF